MSVYEEQVWLDLPDTSTPISAERLAHMEAGIANAGNPNAVYVMEFDGTPACDIYHGQYWPPLVNLGHFLYEFWCAPYNAGSGYLLSDGYGGAHAVLLGFIQPAGAGDLNHPGGNLWNGTTNTSFTADDGVANDEWAYVAYSWDGTNIALYIDGICVGLTAFAGPRQSPDYLGGGGGFYIAGSDHSNYPGKIAMYRGFEDYSPRAVPSQTQSFSPDRIFSNEIYAPNNPPDPKTPAILCSLMQPGQLVIVDNGAGYNGRTHSGQLRKGQPSRGHPSWIVDSTAPFDADGLVIPTGTIPAAPTMPVGAKIWAHFAVAKQNPLYQGPTCDLPATQGGSLGSLSWTRAAVSGQGAPVNPVLLGIINGRACPVTTFQGVEWVSNDSPDMDIRVRRNDSATAGTHQTWLSGRVNSADNRYSVITFGPKSSLSVRVIKWLAGVPSTLATYSPASSTWTHLRFVCVGNTLTTLVGDGASTWTQLGQLTGQTDHATATGVGIPVEVNPDDSIVSTLYRVTSLAVLSVPAAPAAPTGLAATGGIEQISLTWSGTSGATNIYRSTTSGGSLTLIASSITSGAYTDTGLPTNTTRYYKVRNVGLGGESTNSNEASATTNAAAATPSDFGTLIAEWDVEKLALSDNALIATLTDSSGVGNHLTASGSARPTYKAGIMNGKAVARFDGSANIVQRASLIATKAQPITIYAWLQYKATPGSALAYLTDGGTLAEIFIRNDFGALEFSAANDFSVLSAGAGSTPTTVCCLTFVVNGTSSKFAINSGSDIVGATSAWVKNLTGFTLGARADGASFAQIDVGGVLAYEGAHDPTTRSSVLAYGHTRWGAP